MSKYTESEKKLLLAMADVFDGEAKDCEQSSANNGSPYSESFYVAKVVLRHMAGLLREESYSQSKKDVDSGE